MTDHIRSRSVKRSLPSVARRLRGRTAVLAAVALFAVFASAAGGASVEGGDGWTSFGGGAPTELQVEVGQWSSERRC